MVKKKGFEVGEAARFGLKFASRGDLLAYVIAFYMVFLIAGGVLVAGVVIKLVSQGVRSGHLSALLGAIASVGLGLVALIALFIIVGWFVTSFMISCAYQLASSDGRKLSMAKARQEAIAQWWKIGAIALIAVLAVLPVAVLTSLLDAVIIIPIGRLLNFLFSLFIGVLLLYAPFYAVGKGRGVVDSVRSSLALVAAVPLETLVLAIIKFVAFVAAIFISLLVFVFSVIVSGAALATGGHSSVAVLVFVVVQLAALVFCLAALAFVTLLSIGMVSKAVSSVPEAKRN